MPTKPNPIMRKVGPLPLWAWAFVIVGGYLAYTHFSGGGTASASSGAPSTPSPVPFADSGTPSTPPASDNSLPPSFAPVNIGGGGAGVSGGDASSSAAGTSASSAAPVDSGAPPDAANPPPPPEIIPAGTNIGTVDVNGTPYTGYTDANAPVNPEIIPAINYNLGVGQPVLEHVSSLASKITTPAYSTTGGPNAILYAAQTGHAVAA